MVTETVRRRALLAAAGIYLAIAVAIAIGVIPPVRTDPFPHGTPERAATAFTVVMVLQFLLGGWLLALVRRRGGNPGSVQPVITALLALVFSLLLLDAASAFAGHGPNMQLTVALLYASVASDAAAAGLSFFAAFFRRYPQKVDMFSAT